MIIVGIDPGYKEFGYYICSFNPLTTKLEHVEVRTKEMIHTKTYSLKVMKKALNRWYNKRKLLLTNAQVIIENQPFMRFANIVRHLQTLMPHATVLDVCGMKVAFGISTGKHASNKRAAVEKFGWLLPKGVPFKKAHNLIDPFLLVLAYLIFVKKFLSMSQVPSLPLFSKNIIKCS
jgi:hypothetical protein